jgi:hypothetical protein
VACECSSTDVLNFTTEVAGAQKANVFVTVQSECRENPDRDRQCEVVYTVTNHASANTNVTSLTVAGENYVFGVEAGDVVAPGQVGTVTVVRPGGECELTSSGSLTIDFPTLSLGGVQYGGLCLCTLVRACGGPGGR